jgi:hypothetical protein
MAFPERSNCSEKHTVEAQGLAEKRSADIYVLVCAFNKIIPAYRNKKAPLNFSGA